MDSDDFLRAVAEHWDDRSTAFDEEPDHGLTDPRVRDAWTARLLAWLPPCPADVADLGCGTGALSVLLASHGYNVIGVDLSPRMVACGRAKAADANVAVTFTVGDAAAPGLQPRSQDAVLVRHLVWTLTDPHAALKSWVDLLRPGGRIVLVEGRWADSGGSSDDGDYATVRRSIPWYSGVSADTLADALAPLVGSMEVHDLSGDEVLWGRAVEDERYAIVGQVVG